jgi:hypothetical protein
MTTKKSAEEDAPVRPFASFLQEVQNGRTHDELSEAFRDLITAVTETGKGGKLTFTVDVKPMKGGDGVLVITDTFTAKKPTHDRKTSLFYADDNGNLSKENPNQLTFEGIKAVEDKPAVDISSKEGSA